MVEYIIYRPSARGFGEILPSVMIFPSEQSPSGNIITSGNISPNPPRSRSMNDKYSPISLYLEQVSRVVFLIAHARKIPHKLRLFHPPPYSLLQNV